MSHCWFVYGSSAAFAGANDSSRIRVMPTTARARADEDENFEAMRPPWCHGRAQHPRQGKRLPGDDAHDRIPCRVELLAGDELVLGVSQEWIARSEVCGRNALFCVKGDVRPAQLGPRCTTRTGD